MVYPYFNVRGIYVAIMLPLYYHPKGTEFFSLFKWKIPTTNIETISKNYQFWKPLHEVISAVIVWELHLTPLE